MNMFPSFLLALLVTVTGVQSFSSPLHLAAKASSLPRRNRASFAQGPKSKLSRLYMNMNGDEVNNSGNVALSLSESDQTVVAVTGLITSPVMLYSEYVLKMTGCGLPAGPFGLYGAIEGLSYLGVTGLVAISLYTKVKTGSGLPAGKYGLLGAAEGLSFLAVFAGLIVLVLQVTNYGYIPNAVPMEGGICQ